MLFLFILLPPLIGYACLKLLDSKQWLIAMLATSVVFCLAATYFVKLVLGLIIGAWVFAAFFLPWFVMVWYNDRPFPKIDLKEMWEQPFFLLDKYEEQITELWGGAQAEDTIAPPSQKERKLRKKA